MSDLEHQATAYHYPNKMGRIALLAFEEVLGRNGLNAVLNLAGLAHLIRNYPPNNLDRAFPFSELAAIHEHLDKVYGQRGGRGLALRAGRACFKYGLREFGSTLGVANLAFRLLPLNMKLSTGAQAFADIFNRYSDQIVRLEEHTDHILWHIERCPICWGRRSEEPCCHLAVGMLQESLFWVSGGKYFQVEEVRCIACGDSTCTVLVDRSPLD